MCVCECRACVCMLLACAAVWFSRGCLRCCFLHHRYVLTGRVPLQLSVYHSGDAFVTSHFLGTVEILSKEDIKCFVEIIVLLTRDQDIIHNGRRSLRMNVGRRLCILSVISVKIFRISSVADHVESSECVNFNDQRQAFVFCHSVGFSKVFGRRPCRVLDNEDFVYCALQKLPLSQPFVAFLCLHQRGFYCHGHVKIRSISLYTSIFTMSCIGIPLFKYTIHVYIYIHTHT